VGVRDEQKSQTGDNRSLNANQHALLALLEGSARSAKQGKRGGRQSMPDITYRDYRRGAFQSQRILKKVAVFQTDTSEPGLPQARPQGCSFATPSKSFVTGGKFERRRPRGLPPKHQVDLCVLSPTWAQGIDKREHQCVKTFLIFCRTDGQTPGSAQKCNRQIVTWKAGQRIVWGKGNPNVTLAGEWSQLSLMQN